MKTPDQLQELFPGCTVLKGRERIGITAEGRNLFVVGFLVERRKKDSPCPTRMTATVDDGKLIWLCMAMQDVTWNQKAPMILKPDHTMWLEAPGADLAIAWK